MEQDREEDTAAVTSTKNEPVFRSLFSDATETWLHSQSSEHSQHSEGQLEAPSLQQGSYAEDSSDVSSYDCDGDDEEKEEHEYEHEEEDSIDSFMNESSAEGSNAWNNDDEEDSLDSNTSIRSKSSRQLTIDASNVGAVIESIEPYSSKSSPKNRRGILSAKNSFDTSNSFSTNGASTDSQNSIEFEMVADLHNSWTTINKSPSQSQSSSSFSTLGESLDVFVQDDSFCWLPAKVLEHQVDHALVAINLPETWQDSTISGNSIPIGNTVHSSMKKMTSSEIDILVSEFGVPSNMLRKVYYSDYDMGDLPKQNIQGAGKQDITFSENKASSDLADLRELHMAAILYNLKERHFLQKPYTRVGDILIAMNPFVWIDKLYTLENRDVYSQHLIWNYNENEQAQSSNLEKQQNIYDRLGFDPHVYEISSLAYRELAITGQDQTILVTGESGAGKTETVKILMDHLASAPLSRPVENDDQLNGSKDIVARVIQSSPVFEAFGNAKTERNANSSRFGKFIRLQFRVEPKAVAKLGGRDVPYTDLVGSMVSTYLLEKNRVVFHAEGERTFHIFYHLLAAPSDFKQQLWPFFGQVSVDDFLYTAGSASTNIDHETGLWLQTQRALEVFKFKNDSLVTLMQALGIVLQLGNLVFEHDTSSQYEQSSFISSRDELKRLSEMMGIGSDDLQETMTSRTLKTPNAEPIQVRLTPEVAKEACDALAKEIYARIFDVIVKRVNEYTLSGEENQDRNLFGQIALLDIFGFEHFEVNRFEQLCINYCNEKLQGKYVVDNFNQIKNQYIEEGVDLYDFKLVDNSDILHLLEGRHGLITMLNEECLRPKGNDESFVYKAKKAHLGSTSKLISEKLHKRTEFGVNHFAGCVRYDAHSFVLSNMDKLPIGIIDCAARSTNTLIQDEFRKLESSRAENGVESKISTRRKKETNKTVLNKFQVQLKNLMSAMEGTKTRYIRCIKSNKSMSPKLTHHASTMRQMECSGLMTALIISRESYPQNLEYEFIMSRYNCLLQDKQISKVIADMELQEKVRNVLTKWLKPMSKKNRDGSRTMPFACGKTKVFFKAGAQDRLEYLRRQHYEKCARTIQSWFRMIAAMRLRSLKKEAVYKIQSFSRMALAKAQLRQQRLSANIICAWIRCRFAVNMLRTKRESMVLIQTSYRQWKCRNVFLIRKKYSLIVQSMIRMALVRIRLQRQCDAVTLISSWLRSCWCKNVLKRTLAARKVQCALRRFLNRQKCLRLIRDVILVQGVTRNTTSLGAADDESHFRQLKQKESREEYQVASVPKAQIEKTGSTHSISSAQEQIETMHNASHFEEADDSQMLKVNTDLGSPDDASSERMLEKLKARIDELTKTNNGLVKEVFKLRHEKERMHKQHRSTTMQMSSKLSLVEEKLESTTRKYEKKKRETERKGFENKKRFTEEKCKMSDEITLLKEKHSMNVKNLSDELRKTQESHQEYLTKLMDVLETTHNMREEETAKMSRELSIIKKEKDNQIILLHKEVKALRSIRDRAQDSESLSFTTVQAMKDELSRDADDEARNSQRFNDVAKDLASLVAESNVLPSVVGDHNMKEVMTQQQNAQQMTEMIGFLKHLYRNRAENWTVKNNRSLAVMEDYIAISERFDIVLELRERIVHSELESDRLREQFSEKIACDKCEMMDATAQR